MKSTLSEEGDFAALQLRFVGREIDHYGTNIHQLGRALMASQELINITASHQIRCDFPIDQYSASPIIPARHRVFFLQGHLDDVGKGSLDLLINLINQPELHTFLQDENVRAFGMSVLANLFTHASLILTGRWREKSNRLDEGQTSHRGLAVELAPFLEKLSRTVTQNGGISRIEVNTKNQFGEWLEFRVDRYSRENVLEFAEYAPAREIDIVGEVRSVDLDSQKLVVLHPATGERIEVEFYQDAKKLDSFLRKKVYIRGRIRPQINRWGAVQTRVEVVSIEILSAMQR